MLNFQWLISNKNFTYLHLAAQNKTKYKILGKKASVWPLNLNFFSQTLYAWFFFGNLLFWRRYKKIGRGRSNCNTLLYTITKKVYHA